MPPIAALRGPGRRTTVLSTVEEHMRTLIGIALGAGLVACGGGSEEPATNPEPAKADVEKTAEKPAAEKKEEAEPEEKEEAPDFGAMSDEEKLAYLMKEGENVYTTGGSGGLACVTCHQADGKGQKGVFPPLVGQKDHMGDCGKHAGMVINGLQGEIVVDGVTYNSAMPAQGNLTDLEIAAVITYERQSWGNDYGPCMPEAVAAAR